MISARIGWLLFIVWVRLSFEEILPNVTSNPTLTLVEITFLEVLIFHFSLISMN